MRKLDESNSVSIYNWAYIRTYITRDAHKSLQIDYVQVELSGEIIDF